LNWVDGVVRRLSETSVLGGKSAAAERAKPNALASWRADAPASIVVFLVALPLCLGIALASNAPLFSGVIAGVVGGIVVGTISGSQLMVSGPAAGLTAIVVSAIATMGSYPAFLTAVVIGGGVQLLLAKMRAGVLGYYFPSAVIKGMLAAIGVILILKQLPHAIGYDADYEGDESFVQPNAETTFSGLTHALHSVQPAAIIIGVVGLALLILWDRTRLKKMKLLPGPLAAVLFGVGLHFLIRAVAPKWALEASHLVTLPVPGSFDDVLSYFTFPDWGSALRVDTWRIGVTIGVVASLETLLSLEATDRMDPYKREAPTNRELVAQGVGNIASGLIGGLPVTGVIVRSAANVDAGAQTKVSAVLHGILLAAAAVSIPALLNHIPLASLAAILLYTGFKLAHPKLLKHMWSQGRTQFLPFALTIGAILLTDLLVGIGIGLAVGFVFILLEHLKARCFEVVSPPGSVLKRIRLHEQVSFLNKASLATLLDELEPGSRIEIDGRRCERIDHDVLEFISDFRQTAILRDIDMRLVGIELPPVSPSH